MGYLGEFSALGAALLWSSSSFAFTAATLRIGSIQLNISRMIIGLLMLAGTIIIFGFNYQISMYQFLILSFSGFLGLVIGDTFLFKSFGMIGPRIGLLIMSSNPAIASVLSYFILGEVLTLWGILGIAVTLTGIAIVVLERQPPSQNKFKLSGRGILYAFIGATGQGSGLIAAKMALQDGDINGLTATLVRILAAVIIMLPAASVIGKYKNPVKVFRQDRKALGFVSLGALLGPYLGITLSFIAIKYTLVGIASTIMSISPIIMLPLSKIIYKEKLSWKAVMGAFIAVAGVAILFLK